MNNNDSFRFIRIELEHFARIQSGMDQPLLIIDFNKLPNLITLIVGANGTGKTSLMRCFHPFAYNSNAGDEEENSQLITEGQDGRKELWFTFQGSMWHVKHLYLRKKDGSLTTKSYLSRNEEELNRSGSVTEFEQKLFEYFGLKKSYLGLLSMGNTVSSFVKQTSSGRKKFAVKLFAILDLYERFYKNASTKVRKVKPLLQNVTAKLEKYREIDPDDLLKDKQLLSRLLEKQKSNLNDLYIVKGKLKERIDSDSDIIESYQEMEVRLTELANEIGVLKVKAPGKSLDVLTSEYADIQTQLSKIVISLEASAQLTKTELRFKDDKLAAINSRKLTTDKMKGDVDIHELDELKLSLERELQSLNINPENGALKIPSKDLIRARIYLDELRGKCIDFITRVRYADDIVESIWDAYKKNHDVWRSLSSNYEKLSGELSVYKAANGVSEVLGHCKELTKISLGHHECSNTSTCPYVQFYQAVMRLLKAEEGESLELTHNKELMVDIAKDKYETSSIIRNLCEFIDTNSDILSVVPKDVFDPEVFVSTYMIHREVYDRERLDHMIDVAERQERYDSIKEKLLNVQDKINMLSNNRSMYDLYLNEISELEKDIETIDGRLKAISEDVQYQTAKQTDLLSKAKKLQDQIDIATRLASMREEMQTLKDQMAQLSSKRDALRKSEHEMDACDSDIEKLKAEILKNEENYRYVDETMRTILDLRKEQGMLYERLQICTAVQQAVSTTNGIPVDFIRDFVKHDLISMVNDILTMVYHGKLMLDGEGTVINETEFTIPYTWNGVKVPDISCASDGQKAILTLAFSIVLVKITSPMYNLMLLDEMDTALDTRSRSKYFQLLIDYSDEIKATMLFAISHNNMFDGYPANVLMTSNESISNMEQKYIVRCYEGGNG